MTLIDTLENCAAMWEWLAKHPDCSKPDYFKKHKVLQPKSYCFFCHYSTENADGAGIVVCEACPGLALWGAEPNETDAPCEADNSPYALWHMCRMLLDFDVAATHASKIAEYCLTMAQVERDNQKETA